MKTELFGNIIIDWLLAMIFCGKSKTNKKLYCLL